MKLLAKTGTRQTSARMSFKDYADVSSIHGVGYITSERAWLGRLFWFGCVITGILTASSLSYLNIIGWAQNPTVVSTIKVIHVEVSLALSEIRKLSL